MNDSIKETQIQFSSSSTVTVFCLTRTIFDWLRWKENYDWDVCYSTNENLKSLFIDREMKRRYFTDCSSSIEMNRTNLNVESNKTKSEKEREVKQRSYRGSTLLCHRWTCLFDEILNVSSLHFDASSIHLLNWWSLSMPDKTHLIKQLLILLNIEK